MRALRTGRGRAWLLRVVAWVMGRGQLATHRRTLGRYCVLAEVRVKQSEVDRWWFGVLYFDTSNGRLYATSGYRFQQQFMLDKDAAL